ncbi:hypothetical protein J2802_000849 [Paraburkholderia caribensis]|nr:hypothetical protein [Paraburkholderia caribensis]
MAGESKGAEPDMKYQQKGGPRPGAIRPVRVGVCRDHPMLNIG